MKWLGALLSICLLAGCGGVELIERGFILGVAVDFDQDRHRIVLTSQFYKPSMGTDDGSGTFVNLRTEGKTVFDAVRNIPLRLGRKAQWSHMQAILIGEKLARSEEWKDVIDFFFRDDEPRLTTRIAITKGDAGRYLAAKPYMETTISRQNHESQRSGAHYASKTVDVKLLELRNQLESESGVAVVPYMKMDEKPNYGPYFSGAGVISGGKLTRILSPLEVQSYHMLKNRYMEGIIIVPCGNGKMNSESLEVVSLDAHMQIGLVDGVPHVRIPIKIVGTVRELVCTALITPDDAARYQRKIAEVVKAELGTFTSAMTREKLDVLGIGNELYKYHPRKWARMKEDWSELYARTKFEFDVNVYLSNTGLENGKSVFGDGG